MQKLYDSLSKQRETVGRILERILQKEFSPDTMLITLDQLLDWDLWPSYISVYSKFDEIKSVCSMKYGVFLEYLQRARA